MFVSCGSAGVVSSSLYRVDESAQPRSTARLIFLQQARK
jgi:hypothetical protein